MSSHYQKGYSALISAIVISILLSVITLSLGFSSFFIRFNIVDSESKKRSSSLAEACVDVARLKIIQDASYHPVDERINIGSNYCTIISGISRLIQTQACINKAVTNLKVTLDNNHEIDALIEVPNFFPHHLCDD